MLDGVVGAMRPSMDSCGPNGRAWFDMFSQIAGRLPDIVGNARDSVCVESLIELMRHVHVQQENEYFKLGRLASHSRRLAVCLILLLALLIGSVWFGWFPRQCWAATGPEIARALVTGALIGASGALMSAALRASHERTSKKITELQLGMSITFARVAIGAAAAIPVLFLASSHLINVGNDLPESHLVLCFLGGFSERWFTSQVSRIAGESPTTSESKP